MPSLHASFALAASIAALVSASPALAEAHDAPQAGAAHAFWPNAQYDASIPTLKSVVGHAPGERITRPEDAVRYLQALAAAAPDRVKLFDYATSWQGRRLVYAAIGAPEAIARLDQFKAGMASLADPRATEQTRADTLIGELPAGVWIAYGVHGNEISSTDAGLLAAYHLLSSQNDPVADKIRKDTIYFIDPIQNPDGRARFLGHFENALGLEPAGSAIAAERREPWPSGRTNHYLFDMNRDWFFQTQPETQGRVRIYREWRPLVFVDAHEMGSDAEYFFAPGSPPFNPDFGPGHRDKLLMFGRNNAKWFDRFGFNYFTREVFDEFFPGYGSSWPAFTGSIPMVYEQSSARGLKATRTNGTAYHYRDTVHRHFVASIATLETAADNREKLLRGYWTFNRSAIEEGGQGPVRSYIIPATDDKAAAQRLAASLVRQGIEVGVAGGAFEACERSFEAGAYVVDLAQPAKRLARTLLHPTAEIDAAFLEEQERLREKDLPDQIYDVTAWSMPLTFNIEAVPCATTVAPQGPATIAPFDGEATAKGAVEGPADAVAYLVDWGERPAIELLAHALRDGVDVSSSDKAFTAGERAYAAGTLIFRAAVNGADLRANLTRYAEATGAEVVGVASSWVDEGPNFGSNRVVRMPAPQIAIAWDAPTNPYTAGNTRFVVERQIGYPTTTVRVSDLADGALDQFDVLVLPGQTDWWTGGYDQALGEAGAARLKAWVEGGGTLVALQGATRWLTDPAHAFMSIRLEDAARDGETPTEDEADAETAAGQILTTPEEARQAIAPLSEAPDASSGVLARADVDPDHWLGAGVRPTVIAPILGGDIYTPVRLDRGVNVARFAGPETLVASGHLWAETKAQYAYKPFVVAEPLGRGFVIAFTQTPTYRAHFDGLNTLFANALFRAPAHSSKARD